MYIYLHLIITFLIFQLSPSLSFNTYQGIQYDLSDPEVNQHDAAHYCNAPESKSFCPEIAESKLQKLDEPLDR